MRKLFVVIILMLSGCVNYHSAVYDDGFYTKYTNVYVSEIPSDTYNIRSYVVKELADMGLVVYGNSAPKNVAAGDVIVDVKFAEGWDLALYVKSINVQFIDAQNNKVIATGSYESGWVHATESAVRKVFSKIKEKL